MTDGIAETSFQWTGEGDPKGYDVLWNPLLKTLGALPDTVPKRIFDLGSGNGITAEMLSRHGWDVTGVEPSEDGLAFARKRAPQCRFEAGSAYEDLAARFGQFPVVMSFEVIEHCYYVNHFARTFLDLIEPGGIGILTTPFHGYWKNLALALTNHFDAHFTSTTDGGHIKFFSRKTLASLLTDAGCTKMQFSTVGRIPPLAMSHYVVCKK
jgi:2-polyprenyl-3-methyl-5-hydroxy-6-metoxy-1,4-benzoquinol methylase